MASSAPLPLSPPSAPTPAALAASGSAAAWLAYLLGALVRTLSVAQITLYALASLLLYAGGFLLRALAWTLATSYAAAAWPLSRMLGLLVFLFSPVAYTLGYVTAPIGYIVRFVLQFKALYTFLGSAAVVGVLTGLVVAAVSNYFFVVLQLGPEDESERSTLASEAGWSTQESEAKDDVWLWLEDFKPQKVGAAAATRPIRK